MTKCIVSIDNGTEVKYVPPMFMYRRDTPFFTSSREMAEQFNSWQHASLIVQKLNQLGVCGRINIERL